MSVLHFPRAHFKGTFVTDVGTANNNNVEGEAVVDVANVTVIDQGLADSAFHRWMEEQLPSKAQFGTGLDKFERRIRAGWNYYGDNSCYFQDVKITAVQLSRTRTVGDRDADRLVGSRVAIDGAVMVDLNPAGETTTQVLCDQFSVTGDDGLRCGGRPSRMYSRWLKYDRNHGLRWWSAMSAVFQTVVPEPKVEAASACLQQLVEAGEGLCIRFCLYALEYQVSLGDLARMFEEGKHAHNPAVGRVLGTIGPWHRDELRSVSMHRCLYPPKARELAAEGLPDAGSSRGVPPSDLYLGPASARLDRQRKLLSVDLITTFPERNAEGDKVNYGEATLHAGDLCLPIPGYDKITYEATSGIVDIALTSAQVETVALNLVRLETTTGLGRLEESELALESDDRLVYLDVGQDAMINIRVLQRGKPLGSQLAVTVDVAPWPCSPAAVVEVASTLTIPPGGKAELPIRGKLPGGARIRFLAPGLPTPAKGLAFDSELDSFIEVRVLPDDTQLATCDPTFDLVAKEVLRYYHLLHPAMNEVIDLTSESVWRDASVLKQVRERIGLEHWEGSDYMPRTRDLSSGKRVLLQRWCDEIVARTDGNARPGT